MVWTIIGAAVAAVMGQVLFYFIQKALDKWWDSHFPPSNENKVP